ncbi:N-acetylmuramoyl-L-alanine amidase CwlA [Bacillus subtilis]|nr:N-acetylmuramoyl-L-alanine amidase CwlA [Bacillus subtilis]
MTIAVKKNLVSEAKYALKCPNYLDAEYITIHNTANDASAANEVSYMTGNTSSTSFHFAVDDKEVIQGLPLNRNAWHTGDGTNDPGRAGAVLKSQVFCSFVFYCFFIPIDRTLKIVFF